MTRAETLREKISAFADAIIITDELNQYYISGFRFTDGYVVVTKESAHIVTDFRYIEAAETLAPKGIFLAAQCCEHLTRAIIIEKEAARLYGFEIVNAVPHAHAGGSFATTVYSNMKNPVAVEAIKANAGIDIGDTLIGMHLRAVAVPVRSSVKKIGEANLVMARTRAKYIGGERAKYN